MADSISPIPEQFRPSNGTQSYTPGTGSSSTTTPTEPKKSKESGKSGEGSGLQRFMDRAGDYATDHVGFDLGARSSFFLQDPYQMPVLDFSVRAAFHYQFSDRFTLRTSAGVGVVTGSAQHEFTEDLGAPAFEDMDYNVAYPFSREHVARLEVGGALGGILSPELDVSAQIFLGGKTRLTPHLTLGLNQVTNSDTVTTVTETKTHDSDIDLNEDDDLARTYEDSTTSNPAVGVTIDVIPAAFKVSTFQVGAGVQILVNEQLDGVRVVPVLEATWQPDLQRKK